MAIDHVGNYMRYKKFLTNYIKREGIDNFIKWLDTTDASIAPASTKYHLCEEGGLIQHSLNVFYRLIKLIKMEYGDIANSPYTQETIALVSLLHDISKVNYYQISERNVKNPETGVWEKVPYYSVREENDRLIFGSHSEDSYYIAKKFFDLTYDEELAILYHMGGLDTTTDSISLKNVICAFKRSPLATLLHVADLMATSKDEVVITDSVYNITIPEDNTDDEDSFTTDDLINKVDNE